MALCLQKYKMPDLWSLWMLKSISVEARTSRSVLSSEHYRHEDFDHTGQTVRLKDGVCANHFQFPSSYSKSMCVIGQQEFKVYKTDISD